jgi:hypothetical protein
MGLTQVYDHGLALEFMLFPHDFAQQFQSDFRGQRQS